MKLGIATSVLINYNIFDAIRIIAETGYDGVDIWGGRPHVYRRDYSPEELFLLAEELRNSGLAAASFMPAFFRYPHSLSSPNEIVRQDSLDYMRQCADNAALLGAEILLVIPGRRLFNQDLEDAHKRLVDSVNEVCEYCQQYDFRLGIEPANRYVTDLVITHSDALEIIGQVGNPNLGIVLDTGHLLLNKENIHLVIRATGSRLFQFHVNDNDGLQQQNLIPGDGRFDFRGLLNELDHSGFRGFLSAELGWQYTTDPVPAVQENLQRMRVMISNTSV